MSSAARGPTPRLSILTNDRFRGLNETVDPVAGHIPGATNAPFAENLQAGGKFKSADEIRQRFQSLADRPAEHIVMYCGSGVTAAHNILAFAVADKGLPRLYIGSWSDWITDPRRPVATGE